MNLPQLPLDKAMHLIYGVTAGLVGAVLAGPFATIPWLAWGQPWHGALIAAAAVGVGKEMLDKFAGSGEPSWQDAAATVIGGAAIALATVSGSAMFAVAPYLLVV